MVVIIDGLQSDYVRRVRCNYTARVLGRATTADGVAAAGVLEGTAAAAG